MFIPLMINSIPRINCFIINVIASTSKLLKILNHFLKWGGGGVLVLVNIEISKGAWGILPSLAPLTHGSSSHEDNVK